MGRYKIEFQRQWIERDTVERVIEADNPDHALQIAEGLAAEYDSSCPDDVCGTKDGEASSWGVEYIVETDEPLTEEAGDKPWSCPRCGNTDQDGGTVCIDCGQSMEADNGEDPQDN